MKKKLLLLRKRAALRRRRHIRQLKIVSQHPFAIPVFTVLALGLITGASIYLWGQRHADTVTPRVVIVSHDDVQEVVPARQATVGDLLSRMNVIINQGDVVEPSTDTIIDQDQFRINIYRARPVEVIDNGQHSFTYSAATTPRSIAAQAGMTTYAEDTLVTVPVDNFVQTRAIGQQVKIIRATPVNVNLYGTPTVMRTQSKTVGDLLKEKKISLASDDQVVPATTTPITANMPIFIVRNGTKLSSETQSIDMPVQTIYDNNLAYGTKAIRQQGSAGQQVVTYQVRLQNDKEVGRDVVQTVTTQDPITQIVAIGTNLSGIKGDMAEAGISPADYAYVDYIVSRESGWCPTKWQGEYGGCPAYHGAPTSSSVGYGLCQATPGYKMSSAGSDWATNPITQLEWCNGYAVGRYGSWAAAKAHWASHGNW